MTAFNTAWLRCAAGLTCTILSVAAQAQAPARPATLAGISTSGLGYTTVASSADGLSAKLGRWDTPYPGGPNGPPAPGLEPAGTNTLEVDIDVNDGGLVSFDYALRSWDSGNYDWLDIFVITPTGRRALVEKLGTPGTDYGAYFESGRIALSINLDEWRDKRVKFVFVTRHDGWGDQTQAEVYNFAVRTCPVAPITALTDAEALRFENGATVNIAQLQQNMRAALGCVQRAVVAEHGRLDVGSAYRPPSYQAHLREVWDKWRLLRDLRTAECATIRTAVRDEFVRHRLLASQRPASPNGLHTQGRAIDMTSTLPVQRLVQLAAACQLIRPLPVDDPVHFTHQ